MRPRLLTPLLACLVALPGLAAPAQAAEQVVPITAAEQAAGAAAPAPAGPTLTPAVPPGRLDSPATLRRLGLPSVLAAVLAGGVLSLLVRLLLAEPAARRRTPGPAVATDD